MQWHTDPPHIWTAIYRAFVILALLVGLYLKLDIKFVTEQTATEVKGIQVNGTPTPTR